MQRNSGLNHEEYNYERLTAFDVISVEHKREDVFQDRLNMYIIEHSIAHERVFLRFHENATNRYSIRLNTNQFEYMGQFSRKHFTHRKDVADPT